MDMEKVAQLVKIARQSVSEKQRNARMHYRQGGAQTRRKAKVRQRVRRRQGGNSLKSRVHMQELRLKNRPVRIRKEPLQKRVRDS